MSHPTDNHAELFELLEALCEDRLSSAQAARLEKLVLADRAARRLYLDYIDLHGSLHWDAAQAGDEVPVPVAPTVGRVSDPFGWSGVGGPTSGKAWAAVAACLLVAGLIWSGVFRDPDPVQPPVLVDQENGTNPVQPPTPVVPVGPPRHVTLPPPVMERHQPKTANDAPPAVAESAPPVARAIAGSVENPPTTGGDSSDEVVAFINAQLRASWEAAGISPADPAQDAEWLRRVYLDLAGHVPSVEVIEEFLADRDSRKRSRMVDRLLDEPDFVRHFATVWTNLLVGRSTEREVHREALHRFLRQSFAANQPWSEVVRELVAAEGTPEENGASGFLLAHLNNEAVPATAITARLFLCTQVQCTQCHSHPWNDADQSQFWELNSFFKQTEIVPRRIKSRLTGETTQTEALVSRSVGGPTFFENRHGVMQAAYPKFAGVAIEPDKDINRRQVLAKLMTTGERPQVAVAMVNRMWSHFLGRGFTNPVDDMGPHNPPTHPQLLDRLAQEFVDSGYDVKQLARWICNSEAYQLASGTSADGLDPSLAQFSRMAVRPMTAEQVYDSLLLATKAQLSAGGSWEDVIRQRQQWLQQFVVAFDTEENDEQTHFSGTVPQALLLMNSELVDRALSLRDGTFFHEVMASQGSTTEKIRQLCLAALSREPLPRELAAARKLVRSRMAQSQNRQAATAEALQDVFWAFLNSSEFVSVP